MPTSVTARSTPRLSEVARHVVIPAGIVTTAWPRVVAKCAEMGVSFDLWQHGIGSAALGKRKDGKYAATVGGVVLSIPRQVGKTFLVGMIVIALCVLFPGLTVLWTAHRTRTASKTFGVLQGMVRRKKIWPHVESVRRTNGEQEIRFRNGSVIMFGAREQGFGRGFDEVDVEVFDEAQILTEKALEDMVAAANQSRQESGALLFFMGTPPRPDDPGEEFARRRRQALAGQTADMVYVEFSADKGADMDDRKQWAKANPSYPSRTPVESMLRMRANLTNEDSFAREALGIWDDDDPLGGFFPPGAWDAGVDAGSEIVSGLSLGVAVSWDRSRSAVCAAGFNAAGRLHLEPVTCGKGTAWVPAETRRLHERHGGSVAVDGKGPASVLLVELQESGVPLTVLQTGDVLDACGLVFDAVAQGEHAHLGASELDGSVRGAKQRPVGDRFAIGRRKSDSDTSPLEACVVAAWAAKRDAGKPFNVW